MVTADLVSQSLKDKIRKKIREFDITALLKLLERLGFKISDILFRSSSTLASTSSLCEDILFPEEEKTHVLIFINIGLLSAQSPLPTFFRKKMEGGKIDPILFNRFLNFFDHFIIRNLLIGISEIARDEYLPLITLNSPSTLAHLFQICFPELKVEVVKFPRVLETSKQSATLGSIYLGRHSFLGKSQELTLSTFKIILTAEEIETDERLSWPVEIKKRVKEYLLFLLMRLEAYITLILTIKRCREKAYLGRNSYLGYSRIGESGKPFNITLFSGYVNRGSFNPF